MKTVILAAVLAVSLAAVPVLADDPPQPLKVLLITGGCCHDYKKQKDILKEGLEKRANVIVEQVHSDDRSTKPPLPIYGNPDYAKGYDVVIHDECAADIKDPAVVEGVLKPHREGIPAVNLHCAMHSYRTGNINKPADPGTPDALWFEYLGLQSAHHGAQKPIETTFLDTGSPITKGMANWTTIKEELYNNVKVWDDATPLARGKQDAGDKPGESDAVVVWTHEYGEKKTRVFSTTLGHNNETVADDRYLNLVIRGLLWACDKLNDDGTPKAGYGPVGIEQAAAAKQPDTETQAAFGALMTALEADDYGAFVLPLDDQTKEAMTKLLFEQVSALYAPRLKKGYEAIYLGEMKKKGYRVHLWHLTFKDGGDDVLAELSLKDKKVGGFFLR